MKLPRIPGLLHALVFAIFTATCTGVLAQESSLHYLQDGKPDAVSLLAPPPLPDSAEQVADLAEVRSLNKACTSNEVAQAVEEKKFSILTFNRAAGGLFQPGKLPLTEAFIARVHEEAKVVTDHAKEHWKRPRPYTLDPSLASGKLETSFSYPSGHSTEAMTIALVLAELLPDRRDDLLAVGRGIGWHRVLIGRHYPTDIYAGRVLAQAIVREMKSSPDYQRDFAQARNETETARRARKADSASLQPAGTN
jgi:acid phosphatase (class A)